MSDQYLTNEWKVFTNTYTYIYIYNKGAKYMLNVPRHFKVICFGLLLCPGPHYSACSNGCSCCIC